MRYRHKLVGGRFVLRSLFRVGDVWHCRIRDTRTGKMSSRTTMETDRDRAERAALAIAETAAEEAKGFGVIHRRKFDEAYQEWLDELVLSPRTRIEYESNFSVFKGHFRGYVDDVTRDDVMRFKQKRESEVSARTVSKQLTFLRRFFRRAVAFQLTDRDPTLLVKASGGRPREGIALSRDEARELLRVSGTAEIRIFQDPRRGEWEQTVPATKYLRLFVLISLHTGLRKSNVLQLRWNQIDLEKRSITFSADEMKMRRRHVVPIHGELIHELRGKAISVTSTSASTRSRSATSAYVLGRKRSEIRKAFLGAVRKSTLPYDLRIHDLRHTFSTWCQLRLPFLMAEYLLARQVRQVGGRYYHPPFEECLKAIDSLPWIDKERKDDAPSLLQTYP